VTLSGRGGFPIQSWQVISLSASSNVKDMSRLTEKQEHRCLQSDLHSWACRIDGCMRGEKTWMNEWRRNVIQNQCEKYVSINQALPSITTGLIKAKCQNE